MTTYNGPAVLIEADGTEHDTTATLSAGVRPGLPVRRIWAGRLDLDGDVAWRAFEASDPLTLRLPDGREGGVLVQADGQVTGSGPAPFGE
ncbi:hypothetical protein O7626_03045 [Micromonospora sp. WMMD1102]|uniref:hypothetical protein n=1 Tax=Micromonospora sp. WMMD1102 TaxID=3016105 RepID=UPI00241553DB|nr:hypothetical protein [Micromonospora sp. WMMD1102]MDG4784917.1 hypothetical protein [Micromonospora sp. WMMD1102]